MKLQMYGDLLTKKIDINVIFILTDHVANHERLLMY